MRVVRPLPLVVALVLAASSSGVSQTAATARVMREKLVHVQQVLRAIMISDYALLEKESLALSKVTEAEGWKVLTSPEYLRQSSAFVQTMQDLVAAAKGRDLDGAAVAYTAVTMRCYQCHRYLKGIRIANGLPTPALLRGGVPRGNPPE